MSTIYCLPSGTMEGIYLTGSDYPLQLNETVKVIDNDGKTWFVELTDVKVKK